MSLLHRRQFWQWSWVGFVCLMFGGCFGHIRLTRQQLQGADPETDLAAAPVIRRLRKTPSTAISVFGVRLLDTLQRAQTLWGKPTRIIKKHYFWDSKEGLSYFRVLVGRQTYVAPRSTKAGERLVIRQIDVFSPYRVKMHPRNHELFDPKRIESDSWRQKIFGSTGIKKKRALDTRFIYTKWGYQLLLLSKLLPLQRKVTTVFTLYLNRKAMAQHQVVRIP